MKAVRYAVLVAALVAVTGCFRQVVQTGRTPSATVIDRPWVATWLWGLVPATPIDVSAQCRSGIATVTTEETFMNGLVHLLTLGIYAPRHVTITCATGSAMLPGMRQILIVGRTIEERQAALQEAIEESARLDAPVALRFQ
jgi:hypothetical protein